MFPDALTAARGLLAERRWFEAHEALEVAWRAAEGPRRRWLQGLVQLAVSLEHLRRGNARSAQGQWEKSSRKLVDVPEILDGIAAAAWRDACAHFFAAIALSERASGESTIPVPDERDWPRPETVEEAAATR